MKVLRSCDRVNVGRGDKYPRGYGLGVLGISRTLVSPRIVSCYSEWALTTHLNVSFHYEWAA